MLSIQPIKNRVTAVAVSLICCALMACAFLSTGQQAAPPDAKTPQPTALRGEEAVKRLKQDGSYQSLIEAISTVIQQAKLSVLAINFPNEHRRRRGEHEVATSAVTRAAAGFTPL